MTNPDIITRTHDLHEAGKCFGKFCGFRIIEARY
jgi:hypothetical protein